MRSSRLVFFVLLLSSFLFASDSVRELKVHVVDPSSAAVGGARVAVFASGSDQPVALATTDAHGDALFHAITAHALRVEVLAPGFARLRLDARNEGTLTAILHLAPQQETVVVTADATLLEAGKTGVSVSTLDGETLDLLNLPDLSDNLRFMPGVAVAETGQRGGLGSMFVRGGDSTYNKLIVDGVPINEDGGTINVGVVPTAYVGRVEMVRGAVSTLYGSDAMTSVTQLWTATGQTRTPELSFGSEGGTFATAHGFASLAGARDWADYNVFADQFNTDGQGVNDGYSDSTQGANIGARWNSTTALRLRVRHANSRSGVQSDWYYPYPGVSTIAPDHYQYVRQNDFLSSLELTFAPLRNWQNTVSGFEYSHVLRNFDPGLDTSRPSISEFDARDHLNRAGFDLHGEITERSWSRSIYGFHFEDENAHIYGNSVYFGSPSSYNTHGLRRNTGLFGEQLLDWKNLTVQGGVRWEHNENFGDKAVPRVSASYLLWKGRPRLSGTRLRGAYSEGIKEPSFEQSFGIGGTYKTNPNPNLKPEQVRALEAGFVQGLFRNRWSLTAVYFHNRFTNQIDYNFSSGQYINTSRSLAHGAEVDLSGRLSRRFSLGANYTYTATQVLYAPLCTPGTGCAATGQAFIRRPKQMGSMLARYTTERWGASLAGSFVGRRTDFDFETAYNSPYTTATVTLPGYARVDASGYYNVTHRVTVFATVQNLLDHKYEEVAGYPAYKANFRAGLRFRLGGEE